MNEENCSHTSEINLNVTPSSTGCEECLKTGDTWVNLRMCLICGHVGCCDSSVNKHARAHFNATHHAIIKPFEPKGDWLWCYIDDKYVTTAESKEENS